MFAHAAVTDVSGKKLLHDQRIARAGFDVAQASESDTALTLRDWSLVRTAGRYQANVIGDEFQFSLALTETQPMLLQGNQGLSRKGPDPAHASYYYSLPQLQTAGSLKLAGSSWPVEGTAWFDHEWSQALMPPQAVGWDWIGMNLHDGSALTAFRLRDKAGQAIWAGGSFRPGPASALAVTRVFKPDEVQFTALHRWKSPMSQADYPVEWTLRTPNGTYTVKAMLDQQELDSRNSTGAIYWEGLSELRSNQGQPVGRGYLEMTGYAQALRL
jgi:predicted secreted hydrolase